MLNLQAPLCAVLCSVRLAAGTHPPKRRLSYPPAKSYVSPGQRAWLRRIAGARSSGSGRIESIGQSLLISTLRILAGRPPPFHPQSLSPKPIPPPAQASQIPLRLFGPSHRPPPVSSSSLHLPHLSTSPHLSASPLDLTVTRPARLHRTHASTAASKSPRPVALKQTDIKAATRGHRVSTRPTSPPFPIETFFRPPSRPTFFHPDSHQSTTLFCLQCSCFAAVSAPSISTAVRLAFSLLTTTTCSVRLGLAEFRPAQPRPPISGRLLCLSARQRL